MAAKKKYIVATIQPCRRCGGSGKESGGRDRCGLCNGGGQTISGFFDGVGRCFVPSRAAQYVSRDIAQKVAHKQIDDAIVLPFP